MDAPQRLSKQRLLERLRPYGQEHLVRFWDRLDDAGRRRLAQQIDSIDLDLVRRLAADEAPGEDWAALAERAEPPPVLRFTDPAAAAAIRDARRRGEAVLAAGKVGAIIVAGGQGSRLGFPHPKGMFPLGPVSGRTLFQIHIDRLRAVRRRYGAAIPLYLMTSDATHDETVRFLEQHGWFGLPPEDVRVFRQGCMPAVDARTGRILLARPDAVFLSPDGHGGMLAALARHGCLEDARRRGVEHFFYGQVDNPLLQLGDPRLIGCHVRDRSEMTTQVVRKEHPSERVGHVVRVDGRLRIIEYSDLPREAAERREPDGSLRFWAGSIGVHVFERAFLERMAGQADALPFHRALKKAPYVDSDGRLATPSAPNAIKFERFIFDLLPSAERAVVVEEAKQEAFAPVKNANGAPDETPETARAAMSALHRRWLESAGAVVADGVRVEINPLWALDAEETARRARPGLRIERDTYFH